MLLSEALFPVDANEIIEMLKTNIIKRIFICLNLESEVAF
jgi:hypothetical protein